MDDNIRIQNNLNELNDQTKNIQMEFNIVQRRKTSSTKSCTRISTRHKDSRESYQSWELTK